jgi:hypothetical protein
MVLVMAISAPALMKPLSAQGDDAQTCDGALVSGITVTTDRPEFKGASAWWRKFARSVGLHHVTTSEGLVRRFVSLEPGRRCTEFRRSESERILRAQPFLADARVTVEREGDTVRVDVVTIDEVAVVGGAGVQGTQVRYLGLGTLNFRGAGMLVEGRWENGFARRDGWGGKIAHYQMFGRPYAMVLTGMQHPIGENYGASLSHPFYTDLQRIAWNAGWGTSKDFARLRQTEDRELLQPVDRWLWNVGGVFRIGPPRRLWLVGGMLVSERMIPRNELLLVNDDGQLIAVDTVGMRTYAPYDATQTAGVLGIRALSFSRVFGLDALAAEQDFGAGTQIGTMLGIQPFAKKPLREGFATIDAYIGARTRRNFFATRVEAESRLNTEGESWSHLVISGRTAWYFQPRPRWTSELSIEGGGVWRSILPFQLELGDRIGGVRGYARSHETGERRLLARFEQRLDLGRYQRTRAAYGVAAFADAGNIWAGEAPFGVNTPVRPSVGIALLAAVPALSQRTMRGELAVPLIQGQGARPEFRFVVRQPIRGFWFEPPRLRWARLSAVPEQIFNWP